MYHGVLLGAWVGALMIAVPAAVYYVKGGGVGMDAHAYWLAGRTAHPYHAAPEQPDAYLYSPLFAQVLRPASLLPWHVFDGLWILGESACFWWLTRGLSWWWRVPPLLLAVPEILVGNVYGPLAVAIALGLRCPALWAFALLTKVTTVLPGLVWFAVRREWDKLLQLVGASMLLVAVSFAFSPAMWVEWVRFLVANSGEGQDTLPRVALAALAAAVAARKNWPRVLPFAVLCAVPTWSGENKDLAVLLAAARPDGPGPR